MGGQATAAPSYKIDPLMLPPFTGFAPHVFAFLDNLAAHQDRAWFAAHRAVYEDAGHRPMVALLIALETALAERDVALKGDPVASVMRIYRDVRFSKDKSLYKTNIAAALTRTGDRRDAGVLYIHIASDSCFVAAGFYHPPTETLDAIRATIAGNPAKFREIVASLAAADLALDRGDTLTRPPRGFDAPYPDDVAAALKLKSFVVQRSFTRADAASATLVDTIADFAAAASPLYRLA